MKQTNETNETIYCKNQNIHFGRNQEKHFHFEIKLKYVQRIVSEAHEFVRLQVWCNLC